MSPNNGKSNGKENGKAGLCRGTHWDNIRIRVGLGFRVQGIRFPGFRE